MYERRFAANRALEARKGWLNSSSERILLAVSSAPLVPGPLYGLRTWRVVTQDGRERLSAPQRGTPWTLGEGWIEATCGEDHPAPAADCGCGIHAWHPRRASARRILRSRFDLPGIVEADGAVEVHEEGFRAQRARPYAFVRLPGRNPYVIERLQEHHAARDLVGLAQPPDRDSATIFSSTLAGTAATISVSV